MTRPHFNKKERERHFNRCEGVCYICDKPIDDEREVWHIEHVNSWWMSGDNSDDNLCLVHEECHKPKTAKDAKARAKVKRIEAKHKGTWVKQGRPLRSRGFQKTVWEPSGNEDSHDNSD